MGKSPSFRGASSYSFTRAFSPSSRLSVSYLAPGAFHPVGLFGGNRESPVLRDLHGYEPCVTSLDHHGGGLRPARISLAVLLLLRDQCSQRLLLSSKRQSTFMMTLKETPTY
jgi:hypothetical protein